ncbi:hypothetical protein GCM10028787_24760 [Brachybacterium horti]
MSGGTSTAGRARALLRSLRDDPRRRAGTIAFLVVSALWVAIGAGMAIARGEPVGTAIDGGSFTTVSPAGWGSRSAPAGAGLTLVAGLESADSTQRISILRSQDGTGPSALCDALQAGSITQGLAQVGTDLADPPPLDGRTTDRRTLEAVPVDAYRADLVCAADGTAAIAVLTESAPAPDQEQPEAARQLLEDWSWQEG